MIKELLSLDRVIKLQNKRLTEGFTPSEIKLFNKIDNYLDQYAEHYKLDAQAILDRHRWFLERYSRDLINFEKTGKYPLAITNNHTSVDRITYDIALITSCLLVKHRFLIMKMISEYDVGGENILFIGVGTGLEIALLEGKVRSFDAYDLSISDFVKLKYKDGNLFEKLFDNGVSQIYDSVLCIELLEHVERPYQLLRDIYNSLKVDGQLLTTTAKNIPQFDHIVNFTNEKEFDEKIHSIGFSTVSKVTLNHNNLFSKVNSNNIFYYLKK